MIAVRQLLRWLETLRLNDQVGVDEGGLALRVVGDEEVYLEVGGMPEESSEG